MKRLSHVLVIFLVPSCALACGTERWKVKTLADADVYKTNSAPIEAKIADLVALEAPRQIAKADDSRFPEELTVYKVSARLMGFKKEADGDFHIVISDGKWTMIVEIPDPACVGKPYKDDMKRLRDTWEKRFGKATTKFKDVSRHRIAIEVEGYGFFDFIHGQIGVAKNGFELHPIISWSDALFDSFEEEKPKVIVKPVVVEEIIKTR